MKERRVSEDRADAAFEARLLHARRVADRGAHADGGVHRIEGRERAQRIAADVARHRRAELVKRVEDTAVSAAGAKNRGTAGKRLVDLLRLGLRNVAEKLVPKVLDTVGVELEHVEFGLVVYDLDAHRADLILEERVEFLDDEELLHGLRELRDKRLRKRIRPAEL